MSLQARVRMDGAKGMHMHHPVLVIHEGSNKLFLRYFSLNFTDLALIH
jgi:hypothetical protein